MNTWYANKKVVVTGGAGFIGSHLVTKLVTLGAHVTVLDNLITGKTENLAAVASSITFIQGDITNLQTCLTVLEKADTVFHLAAQVAVPESYTHPALCYQTNVMGTWNLLEAARVHKVQRFVFSSSCAVYGDQQGPCSETTTCNPLSPYAASKYMGEQLCQQYASFFSVPTVCLRYFNVFGPRQDPHSYYAGVVAKFTECMAQNKPITIFGDGSQTRDFVPVSNVVDANLKLRMLPNDLCTGQPINIATEASTSLLELIQDLKKKFPAYTLPPLFAPARVGDIKHSQAHCHRFKELIGLV